MDQSVLQTRRERHAILTLNRPERRNPLPYLPEDGLLPALEACRKDVGVRAVILTGAGSAFCSGLDLEGLKALQNATPSRNRADSRKIGAFFETLRHYPKPLIAALNGPAVAGGAGLALLCDLAVASDQASLRFSEVALGFVPALVGIYLERSVGSRRARELLLTARNLPAPEAHALGLVQEVVPADRLLARAEEFAQDLSRNGPLAIAQTKALLVKAEGGSLKQALSLAEQANARARGTEECREGIRSFLEKRPPAWRDG